MDGEQLNYGEEPEIQFTGAAEKHSHQYKTGTRAERRKFNNCKQLFERHNNVLPKTIAKIHFTEGICNCMHYNLHLKSVPFVRPVPFVRRPVPFV